ncbi:MAG: recombination mediator RecR [Bacteroidales bacterium]
MNFPSTLLEDAVNELSKLPGIGKRSALRLALYLLRQDPQVGVALGESLIRLTQNITYCTVCYNVSDTEVCSICANPSRDSSVVCVVENVKEVMVIENTHVFQGLYHVLGGVISPMDGVGPSDLEIDSLVERVAKGGVKEVILALSTTMEGDTTNFYLFRKLAPYDVKVTTIARGVSVGDELEHADEVTLGRSIVNRISFTDSYKI